MNTHYLATMNLLLLTKGLKTLCYYIRSGLRWECLRKFKKYQNLVRWFNSMSRDYAEPLNQVATYTTIVKECSSGKPVVVAAGAPPRSKDQERALKPVRKVRFVLDDDDEDLGDIR